MSQDTTNTQQGNEVDQTKNGLYNIMTSPYLNPCAAIKRGFVEREMQRRSGSQTSRSK